MARRVSDAPLGERKDVGMAIDGGSSPKLRGQHKGDISEEQIETFFETLADTCNVVRSAKAAGFSTNWAYRKRRKDAAFRNGWARSVREGYAKLELVLLERAMKGTPKLVRTARGTDRVMREYSTALAVALLKRHAETADSADYDPGEDELREVRERILEKLARLKERDAAEQGAVETKAACSRTGLIVWALGRARGPLHHLAAPNGPQQPQPPCPQHGGTTARAGEDLCRSA